MKFNIVTVFEVCVAVGLVTLSFYVGLNDELIIPGRVSANMYIIEPPGTYLISGAIFCAACSLMLRTLTKEKYTKICAILFWSGIALFSIGFFSG